MKTSLVAIRELAIIRPRRAVAVRPERSRYVSWAIKGFSARADMKSTLILLSLACALGQGDGGEWTLTPKLYAGEEVVYSGTCTEESLDPRVQFKNLFQFENRFFVLTADVRGYDVALMTSLSTQEPFG